MDVSSSLPRIVDALRPRRVHLIGVAGNGMRALAEVLLGLGWPLSGSDLDVGRLSEDSGADILVCPRDAKKHGRQECLPHCGLGNCLSHRGARLFAGHAAEHVSAETDLVVYSDAVPTENPERRRAVELGIPAISYFQMLGRLGVGRRTVGVAGTHGKSTTAAMLAHVLVQAGRDPMAVFGATPLGATSGGRAGRGEMLVVEACEYRANFLHLRPQQAAILGIEPDHFDCYGSLVQLEDAFRRFAEAVPSDGFLVARYGCESTRRVTAGLACRIETFGLSADADWSACVRSAGVPPAFENADGTSALPGVDGTAALRWGESRFEIRRFGCGVCEVRLRLPGEHNVLNALAAAALAYGNGVSPEQIAAGLDSFPGLHRRLELLGTWRGVAGVKGNSPIFVDAKIGTVPSVTFPGVTLIDDYAHHPTEVTAALTTVRRMFPEGRVWCVFQPHQASRTAHLLDELAASLRHADKVLVAEIYRAREGDPQRGEVTAADLARRAVELGVDVLPGHSDEEIGKTLKALLAAGDVLVTLGAGDVRKLQPLRKR
jgi:UDP-N-acetylmuramate--alanine ligase